MPTGMKRTQWWELIGWAAGGIIIGVIAGKLLVRGGHSPVPFPIVAALIPLAVAIYLSWEGWQVRRLKKRKRTRLSPLGAARVLVLAWSCSRGGSVLAGASGALALMYSYAGSSHYVTIQVIALLTTGATNVLLVAAGLVVEHWCRIDDDEEAPGAEGSPA